MNNGDVLLRRAEIVGRLGDMGLALSAKRLGALERQGAGPRVMRWGQRPRYRWSDVEAWAKARLRTVGANTTA